MHLLKFAGKGEENIGYQLKYLKKNHNFRISTIVFPCEHYLELFSFGWSHRYSICTSTVESKIK